MSRLALPRVGPTGIWANRVRNVACGLALLLLVASLSLPAAAAQSGLASPTLGDGISTSSPGAATVLPGFGVWVNPAPAVRPAPSPFGALAYDSESDRVIYFGGNIANGYPYGVSEETWSYDVGANEWTHLFPTVRPPARAYHAMVYDSESDRVILFGGATSSDPFGHYQYMMFNDTWVYDYNTNTWTNMTPATHPAARWQHAMAYDTESDRVIMYGGQLLGWVDVDTWAYDYNANAWTNYTPLVHPPSRSGQMMTYDSESDRVILLAWAGSPEFFGETWSYDLDTNTWLLIAAVLSPTARLWSAIAYDSQSDRAILFGGSQPMLGSPRKPYAETDDTWSYDLNTGTWANLTSVSHPSARFGHVMTYASASDDVVFFGGYPPTGFSDETWLFLLPVGGPIIGGNPPLEEVVPSRFPVRP